VTRRSAGRRRPTLSPEAITDAAIRLADGDGLEAVSIRRIAAELDARPMSLYDHFAGKDELLDSMAERVVEEMLVPGPLPNHWRSAMAAAAMRFYVTFVVHPWLVTIFGRRSAFGPNSKKVALQSAQALSGLPLEPDERWTMQGILNDYILGYSLRSAVSSPADLGDAIGAEDLEEAPELAALPENLRSRASLERFELGLQIVLDGIEGRLDRKPLP